MDNMRSSSGASSSGASSTENKCRTVELAADNEVVEVFAMLDANGDGLISQTELLTFLRKVDPSCDETIVKLMIAEADRNSDGHICLEEFCAVHAAIARAAGEPNADELREVFSVFDQDKNGFISASELHSAMRNFLGEEVGLEECVRMIRRVDSDGDGFVDFGEFVRMMEGSCGFGVGASEGGNLGQQQQLSRGTAEAY